MPEPPIRIAIVDDHPVARYGMERIFDARVGPDGPELDVVCAVASLDELHARESAPDVVILDLYLDHGRLTADQIAEVTRRCPALVVSASARQLDVFAAIKAGASGYLVKSAEAETFSEAVRTVAAGGFYVSSQLADLIDTSAAGEPISLAPREREALSLIAQGFTQAQAATRMGVSPATIDTYIKRIRRKLGPGNKADLTRRAIELGEVGDPAYG
ncbi:MAG TPA: response regulator transcription factor [Trebonia sp.]|jgi:DNA-binding NarL/FixJ family response regulator|nr:response regulator transcription factor [Trebonia sp.]